jgi:hypothetical protein
MEFWARQDLEKLADTILLDCFADRYEKDHMPTNIDCWQKNIWFECFIHETV